jgi:hypothetical protein
LGNHPFATFDGKIHKGVDKRIAALPFVRWRRPRCFWSVKPTGNFREDYAQGRAWAKMVLPFLKYYGGPPLISWIVGDMIKAGKSNGLVTGFIRGLADNLRDARQMLVFATAMNDPRLPAMSKKVKMSPKTRGFMFGLKPKIRKIVYGAYKDAL